MLAAGKGLKLSDFWGGIFLILSGAFPGKLTAKFFFFGIFL